MRLSTLGAITFAPVLALACSTDRLSGPEAQAAYARARVHQTRFIEGVVVFVDGQRVPFGQGVDLDPGRIRSIEIVKGAAAERRYGMEAKRGAIFIFTTADTARPPTR